MAKKRKPLEVSESDAVALFVAIGFKTAKKWDAGRLTTKLNALEEGPDEPLEDENLDNLLDDVLAAQEVVVISNEPEEKEEPEEEAVEKEEPAAVWKKGDRVVAEIDGTDFEGKIKKMTDEEATVKFDDGDVLEIPIDDLKPVEEDEPKPEKKKPAKKKPAGKKKSSTAKKKKGPGVIATIIECIKSKPMTKEQILKVLVKRFPDRTEDGMKATINVQLGGRMAKEKDLKIKRDDKGRYSAK